MWGVRRLAVALFLCGTAFTNVFGLEVLPGFRGAVAFGAEEVMTAAGISCALKDHPVSLRGEGMLGFVAAEIAWAGSLVLGYDLAVPWRLQPVLEIGVASAGDGRAVSVYPVVGIALAAETSRWLSSAQIRYQSTPFPLPFEPAPEFRVRPLVVVLGLDRILRR